MKRLLCVIFCAALLFSFSGCSEQPATGVVQPAVTESSAPQTDMESAVPQIQNTQTDVLTSDEAHMLDAIDKSSGQVYDLEKKIWEYREPGMQEFQSSTLLMDMLEAEGFAVQRGVTGKDLVNGVDIDVPTGFVATYEGTGKGATVAILMEYDALPKHYICSNVSTSSRSVIYTGTHVTDTKMIDNANYIWQPSMSADLRTVGDLMREAGYYTAFKGKWHLTNYDISDYDGPPLQMQDDLDAYGFSDWNAKGDSWGHVQEGYTVDSEITGDTISWLSTVQKNISFHNLPPPVILSADQFPHS